MKLKTTVHSTSDPTVCFTFDMDAETMWTSRDPDNYYRPSVLSQGEFDVSEGLDNVLQALEANEVQSTFFVPTQTAHRHPNAIRRIVAQGHPIGVHGDDHTPVSAATPSNVELKALSGWKEELEDVVQVSVSGYRAPLYSVTNNTRHLLSRAGYYYSSNYLDSTKPYTVNTKHGPIVEFPVHWCLDDGPYLLFSSTPPNHRQFYASSQIEEIWLEELMGILAGGGVPVLTLHPQLIGRPGRIGILKRICERLKEQHPTVRFASLDETVDQLINSGQA